jgi:predicted MPP superfamily phosphohydrolase
MNYMKKYKISIAFALVITFLISFFILSNRQCKLFLESSNNQSVSNRIFIMGHVYDTNSPNEFSTMLQSYLSKQIINSNDIGIFSGDIVISPTEERLKESKKIISNYFTDFYVSAGNHDFGSDFNNIYGEYFYTFETNHFLVLGTSFNTQNWLPNENDQNLINYHIKETKKKNVLLISHQLFWINEVNNNLLSLVKAEPNSIPDKVTPSADPFDWIELNDKKLIVVSGDSGKWGQEFYCKELSNNLTVISNGLGGFQDDSIVILNENNLGYNFEVIYINR